MHDARINVIIANAFNGLGDATGDDDFGYSVAWIDLDDYVDDFGIPGVPAECVGDCFALSDWLKTWPDINGSRYALAFIDAHGYRSAVGYDSEADMRAAFDEHAAAYMAWLGKDF